MRLDMVALLGVDGVVCATVVEVGRVPHRSYDVAHNSEVIDRFGTVGSGARAQMKVGVPDAT
ncbi:hypothetical protein GCM10023217_05190 [Gordonia alkaliphila]|uniref:Uncharacterized protein n=1 Tax=Gordonia alkaliphila TaxID=1053547 RepID=A0ABP8YX22_9ACTN